MTSYLHPGVYDVVFLSFFKPIKAADASTMYCIEFHPKGMS